MNKDRIQSDSKSQAISLSDRRLISLEIGLLRCPPLRVGDKSIGRLGDFARAWAWAFAELRAKDESLGRALRFLRVTRLRARYLRCLGIGALSGQRAAIDVWLCCNPDLRAKSAQQEASS